MTLNATASLEAPPLLIRKRETLLDDLRNASPDQAWAMMEKLSYLGEETAKVAEIGNSTRQRQFGIYYTSFALASALIEEAIRLKGTSHGTFFEPCVGGGAFLIAFIDANLGDQNPSKIQVEDVLARCYVADNDPTAISNLKEFLPAYLKTKYGHDVTLPDTNYFVGDSLFQEGDSGLRIRDFEETFGLDAKFDFVVTNPPYLLLKKDTRLGEQAVTSTSNIASTVKSSNLFQFESGTSNLFKLFTEAILDKWTAPDGVAGLLIPRSLLTDSQSKKLRDFLLSHFEIGTIVNLNEGNEHFKAVGQAFSAFAAKKGKSTRDVSFGKLEGNPTVFQQTSSNALSKLREVAPNGGLFELTSEEYRTLKLLSSVSTVSESHALVNLRGEFDMTLDRKHLTTTNTGLRLVQGSNINHYSLEEPTKFVDQDFLNRPKGKWVLKHRIACQQISNMNSTRRLKWAHIPPGFVLANSCNFIAVHDDKLGDEPYSDLAFLLGLLNSDAMNTRFKLLSANNHVSNQEISSFPIGLPSTKEVSTISTLVNELSTPPLEEELALLDKVVENYFFLSPS